MELIIVSLDGVLIIVALWTIFAVRGLGGIIGASFYLMMWGMIFLGLAHITETLTFEFLKWDVALVELVHRIIVLFGFVFLTIGFNGIKKLKP